MVDEGIDVAVRIGHLPNNGLHAVPVGSVRQVFCAAPAYLQRHGRPMHPRDLHEARIVLATASSLLTDWQFDTPEGALSIRPEPRLLVTANQAAINAAQLGWGLTRVLSYQVASQVAAGELELLLERFEPPPLPIHVVYQGGRTVPAKVRSFVDYCVERLRGDAALNPPARS
jgi:DNA-binding transcriptional LysR family regulator